MTKQEITAAYFQGWIDRDADAILATLGADGTYQDPKTGGPISGDALRGYVTGLWNVFPDLTFEIVSQTGDASAAQWIMRGTNSGSMNGLPPTGKAIELEGGDFFTFAEDGSIATVTGYFDSGVIPRQLGLDIIVQPSRIGPFGFGISTSVQSGKRVEPAAFSVTFLSSRNDQTKQKVREGSRASLMDMMKMDEFIGATTAIVGDRMMTVTAWTDPDAPRRVMREGAHALAMKGLYDGELADSAYTSVWTLHRNNGFLVRCDNCGKMTRNPEDGQSCSCGTPLPDHPPYW